MAGMVRDCPLSVVQWHLCRFSSFVLNVKCPSQSACPELVREIAVMSPALTQCWGNRICGPDVCSKWRCGATDRQTDRQTHYCQAQNVAVFLVIIMDEV